MRQMDMYDEHTDVQNMHNEHMNHECMNGLNPHMTHSNNQSDEHASNMNMHDDETT